MFIYASPVSLKSDASADGKAVRLSCTSRLWYDSARPHRPVANCVRSNSTNCGLDGQEFRPFAGSDLTFVCPGACSDAQILAPRFIGAQQVNYRSLVVGGPRDPTDPATAIYRGDSFICAAA